MERNRGGTNSPWDRSAQTQEGCRNGRSSEQVAESISASALAQEEQEAAD